MNANKKAKAAETNAKGKVKLTLVKPIVPFVEHTTRPIQSVFYGVDRKVIRTNHAKHCSSACKCSFDHMQLNHYDAKVVEVFDSTTGVLHAVLRWSNQKLETVFKRNPKATDTEERA
jgi:hypothetical protein